MCCNTMIYSAAGLKSVPFGSQPKKEQQLDDAQRELRRLKAELRRVTEERDILKKAATYFAKESG